jgi:hypothetical protein
MTPDHLRASARSLEGFMDERHSQGEEVSPELREAIGEYRTKASAIEAYENRPLRCKLGLHSRRQGIGGSSPGTCVICRRDELPPFYEERS